MPPLPGQEPPDVQYGDLGRSNDLIRLGQEEEEEIFEYSQTNSKYTVDLSTITEQTEENDTNTTPRANLTPLPSFAVLENKMISSIPVHETARFSASFASTSDYGQVIGKSLDGISS